MIKKMRNYLIAILFISVFIWIGTGPKCLNGIFRYRDMKQTYSNPIMC